MGGLDELHSLAFLNLNMASQTYQFCHAFYLIMVMFWVKYFNRAMPTCQNSAIQNLKMVVLLDPVIAALFSNFF